MNNLFRIALKNIRNGGDRLLIAFLSLVFGITALVALSNVSRSLEQAFVLDPPLLVGGDITASRAEPRLLEEHLSPIKLMKQRGDIEDYTLIAYADDFVFRKQESASWIYPGAGFGVDTGNYPLRGAIRLEGSETEKPAALLEAPYSSFITADLAAKYEIQTGDEIVAALLEYGKPVKLQVTGILSDTPNHQGSKVYYSQATAQALADGNDGLNTLLVTTPNTSATMDKLLSSGWLAMSAYFLAQSQAGSQATLSMLLRGSGLMGLLVAGLAIANTMQFLLSRRKKEVAIWKALGYADKQIYLIFLFEAGLIGLAGSLLGTALGSLLSRGVADLVIRTSTMLVNNRIFPEISVNGVLIGFITSLIFAFWAVWKLKDFQPQMILRGENESDSKKKGKRSFGALAFLFLAFLGLAAWTMKSLIYGILVLLLAFILLGSIALIFKLLTRLASHFLPVQASPVLILPQKKLRQLELSPILAGVALLIGLLVAYFGLTAAQQGQQLSSAANQIWKGANIAVISPAENLPAVEAALEDANAKDTSIALQAKAEEVYISSDPEHTLSPVLRGIEKAGEYSLNTAELSNIGVYVHEYTNYKPGDTVLVKFNDGSKQSLPIVGRYNVNLTELFYLNNGIIMSKEYFQSIAKAESLQAYAEIGTDALQNLDQVFGSLSETSIVINLVERANRFFDAYQNLSSLAFVMSGLAIMAGLILMANSLSLALLSGRFELGVQKALGYSRRQLLKNLMAEFLPIAAIAFILAISLIGVYSFFVRMAYPMASAMFSLDLKAILLIAGLSLGLTAAMIAIVSRKPLAESPMLVLSERE